MMIEKVTHSIATGDVLPSQSVGLVLNTKPNTTKTNMHPLQNII